MQYKSRYYGSSLLAVMAVNLASFSSSAAFAQDADSEQSSGIEDIVVTAQRREENMQDVPVAVTVANAETLAQAGVVNVTNLNTLSPSISFRATNMASSTSNIQIRGIGTTGNARTFEGAVGVFIDGVYRTRSGQALSNFLDVDSLQILRGPQGTLFGKNTSAGAVLVASAKPDLNEAGVNFESSYANYGTYLVRGALNLPLSDKPVKVKLTKKPDGGNSIGIAGDCEAQGLLKLQKTFAAVTMDPVNARANELLKYMTSVGTDTTDRYNAALSFIESMEPQNQAEVLLLVQMYVTHDAAIRALSQLGSAEWVPTAQTFGNLATKLLRTSQGQMDTLARMRRGGEQVVRHIHVDNRGGQAVIAENVNTGGPKNGKIDDQSDATGAAGIGPALLGADSFGNGVPIPSRKGEATL